MKPVSLIGFPWIVGVGVVGIFLNLILTVLPYRLDCDFLGCAVLALPALATTFISSGALFFILTLNLSNFFSNIRNKRFMDNSEKTVQQKQLFVTSLYIIFFMVLIPIVLFQMNEFYKYHHF